MHPTYIIAIDYEACTGCRICELACSLKHVGECDPRRSRIRLQKAEKDGVVDCVPGLCMNCIDPACEKACPTGATQRGGPVNAMLVDQELCIGCSACVHACPFGATFLDHVTEKAARCDQCEGDPVCVDMCPKDVLRQIRQENLATYQKRLKNKRAFV